MTAEQSIDEELEILKCIYGDDLQVVNSKCCYSLQYQVFKSEETACLVLEVGKTYPSSLDSILVSVNAPRRLKTFHNKAESIIEDVWEENPGGNVLFTLIDRLAEELRLDIGILASSVNTDVIAESKAYESDINVVGEVGAKPVTIFKQSTDRLMPAISIPITHGPVVIEMKSTFQAHLAAITSMDELNLFRTNLLSDRKVSLILLPTHVEPPASQYYQFYNL